MKVAISFMNLLKQGPGQLNWPTRYIVLLWLSLICRIPFDLSGFDEEGSPNGHTAQELEDIARFSLDKAGLERDGAALLMARLYTRYVRFTRLHTIKYLKML